MGEENQVRVRPNRLETFVREVLEGVGLTSPHRDTVSEALVRADLRGVDSHGVARLGAYVDHFEAGGFTLDPDIEIDHRGEGAIVVDGDGGPGQSVGKHAMERAIELSTSAGIAFATVKRSNHFGTAAFYTEMASESDCIGIAMTNVPPEVIPFGGREPYLGTNPISVSCPTPYDYPITLDMATSIVAMGKIAHVAAERGETIPDGWAVDVNGEPTTDPTEVRALRPVGGAKGYGLGVVVDVLTGVLSGAGPSTTAGELYADYDEPMDVGHFFLAIDVETVRDLEEFKRDVGTFIDGLKTIEPEEGVDEVMLPGEIEAKTMERNLERGVPINATVYAKLETLAERYGVEMPSPTA